MFEYILYSIYFIVLPTRFIYIKSFFIDINIFFFLLILSMVRVGSLQFSPEAEFSLSSYVHITLPEDTEAESPCLAQLIQC